MTCYWDDDSLYENVEVSKSDHTCFDLVYYGCWSVIDDFITFYWRKMWLFSFCLITSDCSFFCFFNTSNNSIS